MVVFAMQEDSDHDGRKPHRDTSREEDENLLRVRCGIESAATRTGAIGLW
jgi:hypothetical protein